ELTAWQLARESGAITQGDPPIVVAPEDQRGRLHGTQASSAEGVEPELPEHASQGASIVRIRNRRVILIDVRLGDFIGIGKCRAHNSAGDPASAERGGNRTQKWPARH